MIPKKSLCWDCANATGGCPWADKQEPVPGWDAEASGKSYHVNSCPLFDGGRKKTTKIDSLAVERLCLAICEQAARDYRSARDALKYAHSDENKKMLQAEINVIERWFRSPIGNLATAGNSEYILKRLKEGW